MAAKSYAETAIHGQVLSNDGRSNLVHVRSAVSLGDIYVADPDLTGLADQLARGGELLVLDLLGVGQNLIPGKVLRGLRDLLVLFTQIFQRKNLLGGVLFNQEASTF